MNNKEIHELVKLINETDLAEFKMSKGDFSVTIRSKDYFNGKAQPMAPIMPVAPAPAPAAPQANTPVQETPAAVVSEEVSSDTENANHIVFKSPMVGTFYRKPSPDKDVFVKVGDTVSKGDVLAIIEAMKLFNEIESEVSGTIVKILVDDQTPVEYDQPLFLIDPA
ncbi:acetyl-CoA carboxylase biotin carboxyl carrier protein [Chitinophagales bacterium]|nr:acetyl-CoA carboxylase biotin carboxyl carrier protein [Chitinophagales bacterium]